VEDAIMPTRPARRTLANLAASALICLALAACQNEMANEQVLRLDPATAAIVNGEPVFVADVELEAISQGLIREGDAFDANHPDFGRVLDQLIDQRLLSQEAVRRGLDLDDRARHRLEIARERILGNLLVENLLSSEVTEETIRQMYSEQVRLQQLGDEVRLARILLETEEEARELAEKLEKGEDFASLAFQFSRDLRSRAEGGEIGWLPVANLSEVYVTEVGNTPVGSVSAPFQSDEGWAILKVQDRRKQAPRTLEEMRPDIVRFLTLSEINRILRELRVGTQVDRMPTPGTDAAVADAVPAGTPAQPAPAPQP
jgi:peptidyl-prolyl cis-trans isomerase C